MQSNSDFMNWMFMELRASGGGAQGISGRSLGHLGRSSGHLGRSSGHLGRSSGHLGRSSGHQGWVLALQASLPHSKVLGSTQPPPIPRPQHFLTLSPRGDSHEVT